MRDQTSVKKEEKPKEKPIRLAFSNNFEEPPIEDWLTPMADGTVFLYRLRRQTQEHWVDVTLSQATILSHTEKAKFIEKFESSEWIRKEWIDISLFIKKFELFEVVDG